MKPRWLFVSMLVPVLAVLPLATYADEGAVQLKDGRGKDKIATQCAVCHSVDYIQMNSPFLDRKGWEASVNKMIRVMGAPIKEEDVPEIVDYLTKYYGQ